MWPSLEQELLLGGAGGSLTDKYNHTALPPLLRLCGDVLILMMQYGMV